MCIPLPLKNGSYHFRSNRQSGGEYSFATVAILKGTKNLRTYSISWRKGIKVPIPFLCTSQVCSAFLIFMLSGVCSRHQLWGHTHTHITEKEGTAPDCNHTQKICPNTALEGDFRSVDEKGKITVQGPQCSKPSGQKGRGDGSRDIYAKLLDMNGFHLIVSKIVWKSLRTLSVQK